MARSEPIHKKSLEHEHLHADGKVHLIRPRITKLLSQASKKDLVIVCAGMGCGKTQAVYDFTQKCEMPVAWIELSKSDNVSSRFWNAFVRAVAQTNKTLADDYQKIGFPDTKDKMNIYFKLRNNCLGSSRRIFVYDDFHLIKNKAVLNFMEQSFNHLPENCSIIMISRELPQINISGLMLRDKVFIIKEDDLNFTKTELNQFLLQQGLDAESKNLSKIYEDTHGWAFIINFVARILQKTPGYLGYARNVIKQDILQLLELEAWNVISEKLRRLLLRLSLTDHRSAELVNILADGDENLTLELKQQNAFVRFDRLTNSYHVHHLFLDFLYTKQDDLTDNEKQTSYKLIAQWCIKNDFFIDAFLFYEKTGDYEKIVSILFSSPLEFIEKNAEHIVKFFIKAPEEIFDHVDFSAAMHVHAMICLGKWQEALDLMLFYEAKYRRLPEKNAFRNRMLGCIYYHWGILRVYLCIDDDVYDFDTYFAKAYEYLKKFPVNPGCWYQHIPGLSSNFVGSAKAEVQKEYHKVVSRSSHYVQNFANGLTAGVDDLILGELLFFQGDITEAEFYINKCFERAQEYGQFENMCRALFYTIRIAVFQGNYEKAELTLKKRELLLTSIDYLAHFSSYDIITGWYYSTLGFPLMIPDWCNENFSFSLYANQHEKIRNYIRTKFCYLTNNFTELLTYIKEKKRQVITLFERIELLAMEACVHFKLNDKQTAINVFNEAYKISKSNGIVMPFIEPGKDMRSLINAVAANPECRIPQLWLKDIKQKASVYFRNQALIISAYKKANAMSDEILLSPREKSILLDLHDGLSRTEIAGKYGLSINTVKLHISGIYNKTCARNRADIFRIAAEYNLLQ